MSYIRICDRCRTADAESKHAHLEYNSKWGTVTVTLNGRGNHTLLFCPSCNEQLYARFDLVKEAANPHQHIIDVLTDYIYDVACDAISNRVT